MSGLFQDTINFNENSSKWDVSSVTDMTFLFHNASVFDGDVSEWDVSSVTNMSYMFRDATSFNGDVSEWDVSSVIDMSYMFRDAWSFNGDVSEWNVSSVIDMRHMFRDAGSFNGNLSEWNISRVTDISYLLFGAFSFDGDLSKLDVSSVTSFRGSFAYATRFNPHISQWNTSSVTDIAGAFFQATSFNQDLSKWDVSRVTDMDSTFAYASLFNGDISTWDTSSVTYMGWMFFEAPSFNQILSDWHVSNVLNMEDMFGYAVSFNGDLSGWNTSAVTSMADMFSWATSFNGNISTWDTSSVTDMSGMLGSAHNFNGEISTWDTSGVTNFDRTFIDTPNFHGDLSDWDMSSATELSNMFAFSSFNGDISRWDVSSVVKMDAMFYETSAFNSDISRWNTSSVTTMNSMFANTKMFDVDISRWDTSSVTNMALMFYNATSFNRDLSEWNTSGVTDMRSIFAYTKSFDRDISGWDTSKLGEPLGMSHMFLCASSFQQQICITATGGIQGARDFFCGSSGSFDPGCATQGQVDVSQCFSFPAEVLSCNSQESSDGQQDGSENPSYLFTIPMSSAYVAAGLNLILEVVIILSIGKMFTHLETRRFSSALKRGDPVRIQELEWPVVGDGLFVSKGVTIRALLRLLLLVAIWVSEFSSEGRTEIPMETKEAIVVGGDTAIFSTIGEGLLGSTHFAANFTDGPTGMLKQVEASCTSYYQSAVGLRRVGLIGLEIEGQLRIDNFQCIGNEMVTVTENSVLRGQCQEMEIYDKAKEDMVVLWNATGESSRAGIAQNLTVYLPAETVYYDCFGSLPEGSHETIIGTNHAEGGKERHWIITKHKRTYYVSTYSGEINEVDPAVDSVDSTVRQIEVQTDLEIAHLLVKAMMDMGVALAPDFLGAISEAWYTNRGSAAGLTNVLLREDGTPIEFLGETGTIPYQNDRELVPFPSESSRPVTDVDVRFLVPVLCVVAIYITSLFFRSGEYHLNDINYISKLYAALGESTEKYATVGLVDHKVGLFVDSAPAVTVVDGAKSGQGSDDVKSNASSADYANPVVVECDPEQVYTY